jgi:hypothetical protein
MKQNEFMILALVGVVALIGVVSLVLINSQINFSSSTLAGEGTKKLELADSYLSSSVAQNTCIGCCCDIDTNAVFSQATSISECKDVLGSTPGFSGKYYFVEANTPDCRSACAQIPQAVAGTEYIDADACQGSDCPPIECCFFVGNNYQLTLTHSDKCFAYDPDLGYYVLPNAIFVSGYSDRTCEDLAEQYSGLPLIQNIVGTEYVLDDCAQHIPSSPSCLDCCCKENGFVIGETFSQDTCHGNGGFFVSMEGFESCKAVCGHAYANMYPYGIIQQDYIQDSCN